MKLRNFLMQRKSKIKRATKGNIQKKRKVSSSLLNNQNYILGRSEKKKILSKFFLEKNIQQVYKILSWFYFLSSNFLLFLFITFGVLMLEVSIIIFPYGFFIEHGANYTNAESIVFIFMGVIMAIIIHSIFYSIIKPSIIKLWNNIRLIEIKSIRDFFQTPCLIIDIKTGAYQIGIKDFLYFLSISLIIISLSIILSLKVVTNLNDHEILLYIGGTFIVILFFSKINFYSLLISPLILVAIIFSTLTSLIKTFIFEGLKSYHIVKYSPHSKIFLAFSRIDRTSASNKHYKIECK